VGGKIELVGKFSERKEDLKELEMNQWKCSFLVENWSQKTIQNLKKS
jgi:hypothetical protein